LKPSTCLKRMAIPAEDDPDMERVENAIED
jgi:hypothetical protein